MSEELKSSSVKGWRAGWYISPLTVINAEKKLQMRQLTAVETE
jgi:aspartate/methionine/tyrosine aminotransferase